MPNISIRLSDDDIETLDRLVVACRAFYEKQSDAMPVLKKVAKETTRSSALRDLLLAWKHGNVDQFSRDLTEPTHD